MRLLRFARNDSKKSSRHCAERSDEAISLIELRSNHMDIRVETPRPHIVLVTIANEPRRNAMSRAMLADLAALWDRLDGDADCRGVVLTGAGEKAFCAGADIGGDLSASAETAHVINRALLKDTPFSKPIVAPLKADCG